MSRSIICSLLCIVLTSTIRADNQLLIDLYPLEHELSERAGYDALKRVRIDSLLRELYLTEQPYSICRQLYEEYRSYNYDTALIYADKMEAEAQRMGDTSLIMQATISRAFVYLSGGLFHEAYTILSTAQESTARMSDDYLLTFARLLYDMSDYADGTTLAEQYNRQGNYYMSLLASRHTAADSAQYWYPLAVIDLRNGDYERSIYRMREAMRDSRATVHDQAIYTSSLAYLYRCTGDTPAALDAYIQAAICDIRSSTFETVALRMIAEILYETDEIALADRYIHIAMNDAQTYHARHRQVSISQLLPIIEQNYSKRMQFRTNTAYMLLVVLLCMLGAGVVGIIVLLHRNRTIRDAQRTIDAINRNLSITNTVKEQLLGKMVAGHSQYLSAVEKYQASIRQKVINRQINELMVVPKNVDARIQRQLLNRQMDEILLSIFPSFVEQFNSLLRPEHHISPKPDELLTPALRIFALIRLGILHNELIAEILDYSVNTVYTYKTRTLNQSDLSAEEFYAALMQIT